MESDGPMTQVVQAKCPFCHNVLRIPPTGCLSRCMQILQADDPGERTGRRGLPGGRDPDAPRAVSPVNRRRRPPSSPARRRSADPFGFDDDPEPVTAPRPRRAKAGSSPPCCSSACRPWPCSSWCSSGRSCASCSTASRLRSRSFTTTAVRTRTRISRRQNTENGGIEPRRSRRLKN